MAGACLEPLAGSHYGWVKWCGISCLRPQRPLLDDVGSAEGGLERAVEGIGGHFAQGATRSGTATATITVPQSVNPATRGQRQRGFLHLVAGKW